MRSRLALVVLSLSPLACSDPGAVATFDRGAHEATADAAARDGGVGVNDARAPIDAPAPDDGGEDAAPSTDAASSATDAPATPSCGALPLCDDFEATTPGAPPNAALWSIVTPSCSGTGAIAIDGAIAHSGARSVKVTGAGGYCNHVFFATSAALATIGPHVFARFYVRLTDPLGDGHVTFVAMKDGESGKDLRIGGQNQVLMWNRETDDATLPAMSPAGTAQSVRPQTQRWTCIEIEVDGTQGALRTWVDGALVNGLVEDGAPTPDVDAQWLASGSFRPAPRDLRFGWESYAGQAETLWFDDVAIAAQRIGCGP